MIKCHWCEKETSNEPQYHLNGNLELVLTAFCDRCQKVRDGYVKLWDPNHIEQVLK